MTRTCPKCHEVVGPNDLFCMNCGAKLDASAPAQNSAPTIPATVKMPEPVPAPRQAKTVSLDDLGMFGAKSEPKVPEPKKPEKMDPFAHKPFEHKAKPNLYEPTGPNPYDPKSKVEADPYAAKPKAEAKPKNQFEPFEPNPYASKPHVSADAIPKVGSVGKASPVPEPVSAPKPAPVPEQKPYVSAPKEHGIVGTPLVSNDVPAPASSGPAVTVRKVGSPTPGAERVGGLGISFSNVAVKPSDDEMDLPTMVVDDDPDSPTLVFKPAPVYVLVRQKTGQEYTLESPAIVGKGTHATVRVDGNRGISRRHLRFWVDGEECFVEDNDSTNGTSINDVTLAPHEPVKVEDGTVIHIADEDFTFQIR